MAILMTGCAAPVYTEKQSEALSQTVYAISDSVENGRYDLLDIYSPEAKRIVVPPKKRIAISPLVNPETKEKYVLIPKRLSDSKVVVVGNAEYNLLLKNSKIAAQLEQDNKNLAEAKKTVDEQLKHQEEVNNKMVLQIDKLTKENAVKDTLIAKKDTRILQLWIALGSVILIFGVCVWLRIKGIL